jgi:SAM-dependent methyltransferase
MGCKRNLHRFFVLQEQYLKCYEAYLARGISVRLDPHDKENPNDADEASLRYRYFGIGADALRIIVSELLRGLRDVPRTVLDFPCGSGRVTRHLIPFFSQSRVFACDLYDYHVDFCVNELGAEGIMSKENLEEVDFEQHFDLIFCGSLLTHLPESLFQSALRLMTRSLTPNGLAIVTLNGRYSKYLQKHFWKYIDDDLFDLADASAMQTGFGYVDYPSDQRTKFDQQSRYGVTLSRPHWTFGLAEQETGARVLGYAERDWDNHQDVLVIGKRPTATDRTDI